MKKLFPLFIALVMFANNTKALDYEPETGFTWMGFMGMNVSGLQNHDYNAKVGATIGFRTDYVLPKAHGTYLTTGIDWTMKGGRLTKAVSVEGQTLDVTGKYNLHYFEIPVRVGFRYNVNENLGLYGEMGPYFAVGIGGRHKCRIDGDGSSIKDAEDAGTFCAFAKTDDVAQQTFQRWDAGVGLRLGMEFNEHYNLMLGFDWGLADIYRNSLRNLYWDTMQQVTGAGERLPKVYNFNFNLAFGYRF